MSDKTIISPIAVDLGAKNTGVYMPQYTKGSKLANIKDKSAHALSFDKNKLTLMMADRTAVRHQRRGHDRRQQAKRLARLVLTNCFGFDFEKHQEAVSFLLNRRGRILGDDIDQELIAQIPAELCNIARKWANSQKDTKLASVFPQAKEDESVDMTSDLEKLIEKIYKDEEGKKHAQEICDSLCKYKNLSSDIRRIKKTIKRETTDRRKTEKERKASVKKLRAEQEEAEKDLSLFEDENKLKINVFAFTDKYDEDTAPKPPEEDDNKGKSKYYSYIIWNLYKIIEETISNKDTGHVLRGIYFDHIKHDLDNTKSVPDNEPEPITYKLKELVAEIAKCEKLHKSKDKRIDTFWRIIGNISNLQLRGLRKYFNDSRHQSKDVWLPQKFNRCYELWIKSLRPKTETQKKNIKEIVDAIKKGKASANNSTAVHLLQTLDPVKTIPPFENQNNRRPPECRSLVLMPYKLDKQFPQWREMAEKLIDLYNSQDKNSDIYAGWTKTIQEELKRFTEKKLKYRKILGKSTSSGKGNSKRNEENIIKCWGIADKQDILYSRSLQFFLDVSLAHKEDILVLRHTMPSMAEVSQISDPEGFRLLSKTLGKDFDSFTDLCRKYYQEVRHSMAGRWFEENEDNLLIVCSEKTRNKRYQTATDFGALFNLTRDQVNTLVGVKGEGQLEKDKSVSKAIESWLFENFKGVKTHAAKCATAQKNFGNYLKDHIAIAALKKEKDAKAKLTDEEQELLKLNANSQKHAGNLAQAINEKLKLEYSPEKFDSVFTFAQIDNIVFGDRNGNAKSCPCCSTDNQARMQKRNDYALAARLRGYVARPIDGVVRKLLNTKARNIAELKIKQIQNINSGTEIQIPIITEQNQFDFEKNLSNIKGPSQSGRRRRRLSESMQPDNLFQEKEERIKQASHGICPYTGNPLHGGEIDHIISRSKTKKAKQTVLNSEANLIYVSSEANRAKSDSEQRLAKLDKKYCKNQFDTDDPGKITHWIYQQLKIDSQYIGNYSVAKEDLHEIRKKSVVLREFANFLRLSEKQQVAFRHALFLQPKEVARQLVEWSLDTSYKAKVNGSQRYFASLIAQHINKMLDDAKVPSKVNVRYDYFEVSAEDISGHRKELAIIKPEAEKEDSQSKYSHIIDATLTFLTANGIPEVTNKGAAVNEIGLTFQDTQWLLIKPDKDGVITSNGNYEAIEVSQTESSIKELARRKPSESYYLHRATHRSGTIYAVNYLPLLICGDKDPVRIGFNLDNSVPVKEKEWLPLLKLFLDFGDSKQTNLVENITKRAGMPGGDITEERLGDFIDACQENVKRQKKSFLYMSVKPQAANAFLVDKLNTLAENYGEEAIEKAKLLSRIMYQTSKKKVEEVLETLLIGEGSEGAEMKYPNENAKNSILKEIEKKTTVNVFGGKVVLPIRKDWGELINDLYAKNKAKNDEKNITVQNIKETFLKDHKVFRGSKVTNKFRHKKAKTVYSLPLVDSEGVFLQKRSSWNGKPIYQALNSSDPRQGHNLYQSPIVDGDKIIGRIKKPYISSNTVYLKNLKSPDVLSGRSVDPGKWWNIKNIPEELKDLGVTKLSYQVDDQTSPTVRIEIAYRVDSWEQIDKLETNKYLKPRDNSLAAAEKKYSKYSEQIKQQKNKSQDKTKPESKKEFMQKQLDQFIDDNSTSTSTGQQFEWKAKGAGYNISLLEILVPVINKSSPD